MRAIQVAADLAISEIEVPYPEPRDDEIILAPLAAGICGTDLHIARGEFPMARLPIVPLHEFAGRVAAVGRDVRGYREGDLVTADPNVACNACQWCRRGRPNLCERLEVVGVTRAGAAAERVAVPARCAAHLPNGLEPGVGALIEPLACACNAIARAGSLRDRRVLVMGAGVMGLLIAILARRAGAGSLTVSDPLTAKHRIATAVGVERAVVPDALVGERFDIVFEAAGRLPAARQVLSLLDRMGIWMQVGVLAPLEQIPLSPFEIFDRELSVIGSNSLADRFPDAMSLMPDIADDAARLITGRASVWDFAGALEAARAPTSVKTQLLF